MVRLYFWSSGECEVLFSLPLLPGPLWLKVVVAIRCVGLPSWCCIPGMKKRQYLSIKIYLSSLLPWKGQNGGARGVMVIVVGIGHDDTSSNPGQEWLHFT